MLSALDPSDFLPIGQYLTRREYDPNILDDGTEFVRLEKELMGNERGAEVVRCGDMYITAQMLELPGLQDLAFRKLKALEKSEPHPAFAILTVVETIFDKANEDFKKYLVQYMADHYWDLVLAETIKVAEVMNENEELAQGVFGLLSGRAEVEVEVEGEGEVREEKKAIEKEGEMGISGEAKEQEAGKRKEQKTTTSSQDTPKDHSATKEDDTTKEGLVQTKEEMIKMAWRESDREATEEDRTKLMQEQPQFCEAYSPGARSSTQT